MSSTTDNEQRFAYLLSPEFQIVNTAGKPLTGGWIEVYIHGTRVKYYCFSDFDGTLHPFQIPLDSLGSNIVLASPTHAYDIYIYNKFGSLVMSRYNVVPACNAADIVEDVVVIDSPDETINVTIDGGSNWHLEVNTDLIATASGLAEVSGALTEVSGALLNKKDKQEPIDVSGSVTKTVTNIKQNENGEIEITYEDIDLPQQVPNVNIISPSGTLDITSTTDPATNTKTFKIDVHKSNMDYFEGYYGRARYEDRPSDTVAAFTTYVDQWREYRYQGDFIANSWQDQDNTTFLLNSGLYLITASIRYKMTDASVKNKEEYIRIATGAFNGLENGTQLKDWSNEAALNENTIQLSFVRSVDDDEDYDNLRGNHTLYFAPYLPYGVNYAEIDHLQIVKLDSIVTYHGGPGPSYKPGYGIEIQDDVISVATGTVVTNNYFNTVVSSINNEINEINTTIQNVTGDITELSETVTNIVGVTGDFVNRDEFNVVTGDITNINEAITNIIGATGDYATTDYVDAAVSGLENYSAGQYISIDNHVINVTGVQPEGDYATNADLQTVSAAIPESEEVEFEELDIAQFAQASAVTVIQNQINNVTGDINNINEAITNIIGATGDYATEEYVDEAVAAVTGQPFEQVNSDWLATSGVAEILNKPDVFQLIAGDNIDITPSGNDLVISASSDVTKAYVDEQINAVSAAIPTLPQEEEVEFEELNLSDYALASAIPDVSVFATKTELADAIDTVTGLIPEQQVNADWNAVSGKAEILNKPQEEAVEFEEVDLSQFAQASAITMLETDVANIVAATGDYATTEYVDNKVASATFEQVNSDWLATSGVAEILNKPLEANIVAGNNIAIEQVGLDVIISATGIPDVSNFVTQQDIDDSIAPVQSQIDTLVAATGDYLTEQVNADWNATSGVSEILNKPETEAVEFEEVDLDNYALASAIPSLDGYATEQYVDEQIAAVTGIIPSDVVTEQELANAIDAATGLIPDVSNFVTQQDIDDSIAPIQTEIDDLVAATGNYLTEQVQSDWTEIDDEDPAYILNKPAETELIAGANITITDVGSGIIISSQGGGQGTEYTAGQYISIDNNVIAATGVQPAGNYATEADLQTVSGAIPESEEITFEEIDLSNYATVAYVDAAVTGASFEQVNSDWNATSGVAEILNKPEIIEYSLAEISAGEGISIVSGVNGITISATGQGGAEYTAGQYIEISNNTISVTGVQPAGDYVTEVDLQTVSGAVDAVSAAIPESEAVEFEEVDLNDYALASAIPSLDGYATEAYVDAAITGASFEQVNADWNATSGVAEILNKPEIIDYSMTEISAGEGISIVSGASGITISATGQGGSSYTAGQYIEISNNIISVTGLQPAGDYATEVDLQTVSGAIPDKEEVDFFEVNLADYAPVSAIPSLAGYATETYVDSAVSGKQDVLTGITDVQVVQSLPVSPVATVLYLIPEA